MGRGGCPVYKTIIRNDGDTYWLLANNFHIFSDSYTTSYVYPGFFFFFAFIHRLLITAFWNFIFSVIFTQWVTCRDFLFIIDVFIHNVLTFIFVMTLILRVMCTQGCFFLFLYVTYWLQLFGNSYFYWCYSFFHVCIPHFQLYCLVGNTSVI